MTCNNQKHREESCSPAERKKLISVLSFGDSQSRLFDGEQSHDRGRAVKAQPCGAQIQQRLPKGQVTGKTLAKEKSRKGNMSSIRGFGKVEAPGRSLD